MTGSTWQSWGRYPPSRQRVVRLVDRHAALPARALAAGSCLPVGNGRSYGDSCLNDGGVVLDCRGLDRVIAFDREKGLLKVEAGVLLADILDFIVPAGWFLPVVPGTKLVTVGGAIANDIHGKNHHVAGTFGRHVRSFELLRSDGTRRVCSSVDNADWYRATIGGLGLTGVITWAEIELLACPGDRIDQEVTKFGRLDEFLALAREADRSMPYSVAWIDQLAGGSALGRGLFMTGRHAASAKKGTQRRTPRLAVPFDSPVSLLNRASLKAFNTLYYAKQLQPVSRSEVDYESFFFPLDGVRDWNRLYGPRGLLQHQSVIPVADGLDVVSDMLVRAQRAGLASFLTVLKVFGDVPSPGLLSFPQPGLTLTLDFANQGSRTLALLDELDEVVRQAGGRVNPYKDARMSARNYQAFFPAWTELLAFIDPAFSSSFWRRITGGAGR